MWWVRIRLPDATPALVGRHDREHGDVELQREVLETLDDAR